MADRRTIIEKYERPFAKGSLIFRDGDPGENMYVVRSGKVAISKKFHSAEKVLAVLTAGDFFGETAALLGKHHSTTTRVIEDARLLVLNPKTYVEMIEQSGEISLMMLKSLCARLSDANAQIEALLRRDRCARVAYTLAALADQRDMQDPGYREVSVSTDRLGILTGLDPQTLLTVLAELTDSRVIKKLDTNRYWIASRAATDAYLDSLVDLQRRMRVLVVDDSPLFREAIIRTLKQQERFEVVGTAENGKEAVTMTEILRPDVITMDVQMPVMNGLKAVREIMAHTPTPILVMTAHADDDDGSLAFEALRAGAIDLWPKPTHLPQRPEDGQALTSHLRRIAAIEVVTRTSSAEPAYDQTDDLLAVLPPSGASARRIAFVTGAGGPKTLASILADLPEDLDAQVLVLQQFPAGQASALAAWLDGISMLKVRLARDGDAFEPGSALIAPERTKLLLTEEGSISIEPCEAGGETDCGSELLKSLARIEPSTCVGVVLTGLGYHGAEGLRVLTKAGGLPLVQHPGDAAADEMPRNALKEVPSARTVALPELPELLVQLAGKAT